MDGWTALGALWILLGFYIACAAGRGLALWEHGERWENALLLALAAFGVIVSGVGAAMVVS